MRKRNFALSFSSQELLWGSIRIKKQKKCGRPWAAVRARSCISSSGRQPASGNAASPVHVLYSSSSSWPLTSHTPKATIRTPPSSNNHSTKNKAAANQSGRATTCCLFLLVLLLLVLLCILNQPHDHHTVAATVVLVTSSRSSKQE